MVQKPKPKYLLPLGLALSGCLVLFALFSLERPVPSKASGSYMLAFESQYSQASGSRIDTCDLCHNPGATTAQNLNPYGTDYMNHGHSFTAIEGLDSDRDGYTNIAEINALTFPGNAADHPASASATPARTPTPPAGGGPTNTPTLTATRTPTPTKTPIASPTATRQCDHSPGLRPEAGCALGVYRIYIQQVSR